jgi:hypothetical protein
LATGHYGEGVVVLLFTQAGYLADASFKTPFGEREAAVLDVATDEIGDVIGNDGIGDKLTGLGETEWCNGGMGQDMGITAVDFSKLASTLDRQDG